MSVPTQPVLTVDFPDAPALAAQLPVLVRDLGVSGLLPLAPWRIWTAVPSEPLGAQDVLVLAALPPQMDALLSNGVQIIHDGNKSPFLEDCLYLGRQAYRLSSLVPTVQLPLMATPLALRVAAFLCHGTTVIDALCLARAYRGSGWPSQLADFPLRAEWRNLPPPLPFPACPLRLGLYPVVPTAAWVEKLLPLGVSTLQLRCKSPDRATQAQEIQRAVFAAKAYGARLFINDHWELAIEAGAYGVHLGQEDLDAADTEAIRRAGLRLGISTHGYYEMLRAHHLQPSYLALGAVFPTTTKVLPTVPQGLTRLAHYAALMWDYPLVAIGGMDVARIPAVLATGVGSVAVVRAITEAHEVSEAVYALQKAMATPWRERLNRVEEPVP